MEREQRKILKNQSKRKSLKRKRKRRKKRKLLKMKVEKKRDQRSKTFILSPLSQSNKWEKTRSVK